ncbi:hypothetical protein N7490_009760 [Penicillium lividum]|nr:hypothetical protein N7490_009760 [Penicillium lividum]
MSHLRSALLDAGELLKPETITTAMTLCTNDVCNGNMNTWNVHFNGVMQLLSAFMEHHSHSSEVDPYAKCLLKWFATMDVLASLSGLRTAQSGLLDMVSGQSAGQIDDICGFSFDLAPLLAKIADLAHHNDPFTALESVQYDTSIEAEILEARVSCLIGATVPEASICSKGYLATELHYTHLAFVHSALLCLHRCIQHLPRDHIKVRNDLKNILDAIQNIGPSSPANILILWPIFSAGCETEIIVERKSIQERMSNMQSLGMGNFTRARESLHIFWASGTSLSWDIYFSQVGQQLLLF